MAVTEGQKDVAGLLRQLSVGMSAYRLFPGNLDQPGFVAASRRISAAAESALADGPVEVEATGETFVLPEGPIGSDEAIGRLARACFERRVERLRIRAVPTPSDLGSLYEVLSESPDEVHAAGGADVLLRRAGVMSVALGELNPQPMREAAALAADVRVTFDEAPFQTELTLPPETADGREMTPLEMAESLFDRFQAVVGALPPEMRSSLDLYRMLRQSVEALPQEQRRMLHAVLLERAMDDPLAERYIGTMSDTELARVLVDVGERFGRDPTELAARLVDHRLRSDDLIDLTDALWKGRIEGGTVLAGVDQLAVPRTPDSDQADIGVSDEAHETVGDILGQSLIARGQKDLGLLREGFPSTDAAQHATAFRAVQDYLIVEQDLDRLGRVMEAWTQTARASLRAADATGVREAVAVLEQPRMAAVEADQMDRILLFDGYRRDMPEPAILRALVERAKEPGGVDSVVGLLALLGEAGLAALLDLLAEEDDSTDRSVIVAIATELARDHFDVITKRLDHQRTHVVRDAVQVAYRAAGTDAMPLLDRAARHPSPEVRAEAVRGIVAVTGGSGVGLLRDLTRDNDEQVRQAALTGLGGLVGAESIVALEEVVAAPGDPSIRRGALEHLARHPLPQARERLRVLAARRGPFKLPRPIRRYARHLEKAR